MALHEFCAVRLAASKKEALAVSSYVMKAAMAFNGVVRSALGVSSNYDRIVIMGHAAGDLLRGGHDEVSVPPKGFGSLTMRSLRSRCEITSRSGASNGRRPKSTLLLSASLALLLHPDARADEGGASFWLPGQYREPSLRCPRRPAGPSRPRSTITAAARQTRHPRPKAPRSHPALDRNPRQLSLSPTYAPETTRARGAACAIPVRRRWR